MLLEQRAPRYVPFIEAVTADPARLDKYAAAAEVRVGGHARVGVCKGCLWSQARVFGRWKAKMPLMASKL